MISPALTDTTEPTDTTDATDTTQPARHPAATGADGGTSGALRHVADLTDEEILAIDGPDSEQVAPLPWAGPRSEEETALAAEVGLRGLVTHGHLSADEHGLDIPADLADALALRFDARAIVYADHSTRSAQETRVLYLHEEETGGQVLVETVNGAGVHRFTLGDLDAAATELATWGVPQQHEGEGRIEGDGLPPELAGLQSAVFVDVVTLAGGGDVETRSFTFYRLEDGTLVEDLATPGHLDLPPRTENEVQTRIAHAVRGALLPA